MRKIKTLWVPLLMAAAALAGLAIGHKCGAIGAERKGAGNETVLKSLFNSKLPVVLDLIRLTYVDSVDVDSIEDVVIPMVLKQLDPHSSYVPAKEAKMVRGQLKSNFGGIGVSFAIRKDTVEVQSVIAGGPSAALGVLPGDRIIRVNGNDFTGPELTNEVVMDSLRGEMGTKVSITVLRHGKEIEFDIIRGEIPMNSVLVGYEVAPGVGLVKIDRFAEGTYDEMMVALTRLKTQGCNRFIVDLRGNTGGFLGVVTLMCNEFLERDQMIVYTEGANKPREEMRATGRGNFLDSELTVLIDEYSASASEIFAGAMQDNDRAMVIGRRSFGKGLVQSESSLPDGSLLRITVSRYHTPSGRCIQRPYDHGTDDYYRDGIDRFNNGELFDSEKVKNDTTQIFHTVGGRIVYGGGGIVPDVFVPYDSARASVYHIKLRAERTIHDFANSFADQHRSELGKLTDDELIRYLIKLKCYDQLEAFASQHGVAREGTVTQSDKNAIENEARAYIGMSLRGDNVLYPILLTHDDVVERALKELKVTPNYTSVH